MLHESSWFWVSQSDPVVERIARSSSGKTPLWCCAQKVSVAAGHCTMRSDKARHTFSDGRFGLKQKRA